MARAALAAAKDRRRGWYRIAGAASGVGSAALSGIAAADAPMLGLAGPLSRPLLPLRDSGCTDGDQIGLANGYSWCRDDFRCFHQSFLKGQDDRGRDVCRPGGCGDTLLDCSPRCSAGPFIWRRLDRRARCLPRHGSGLLVEQQFIAADQPGGRTLCESRHYDRSFSYRRCPAYEGDGVLCRFCALAGCSHASVRTTSREIGRRSKSVSSDRTCPGKRQRTTDYPGDWRDTGARTDAGGRPSRDPHSPKPCRCRNHA